VFTLGEVRLWTVTNLIVAVCSLAGYVLVVPAVGAAGAAWIRCVTSTFAQVFPLAVVLRRFEHGRYEAVPDIKDARPMVEVTGEAR
jgi:O-antigen/teichoic acid export membrane protein